MRITVNRAQLGTEFAWAAKGLPRRAVVPVLAGMILDVSGDTLTLSTFDFERGQRTRVAGEGTEPGKILVTGTDLKAIISGLPKSMEITGDNGKPKKSSKVPVTLTADGGTLTVECMGDTFTLPALPVSEYPAFPEVTELAGVVDGATFTRAATSVAAAAGTDDTLPALTCVNFEMGDSALTMAATDRYRLAYQDVPMASGEAVLRSVRVPAKPLTVFADKADTDGKISIYTAESGGHQIIRFCDDNREMLLHGISGEFPRYRALVRDTSPENLTVNAPALAAAVKRVTPMVEKGYPLYLRYAGGKIDVIALRDGAIMSTVPVPATSDQPDNFTVTMCVNPGYLGSLLTGFDGMITIGINGNKPFTFTSDDSAFNAILMPIRGTGIPEAKPEVTAAPEAPTTEPGTPEATPVAVVPETPSAPAPEASTPEAPAATADEYYVISTLSGRRHKIPGTMPTNDVGVQMWHGDITVRAECGRSIPRVLNFYTTDDTGHTSYQCKGCFTADTPAPAAPEATPQAPEAAPETPGTPALSSDAGTPGPVADAGTPEAGTPAPASVPDSAPGRLACCARYGDMHASALAGPGCPRADDDTARVLSRGGNVTGYAEYAVMQTTRAYEAATHGPKASAFAVRHARERRRLALATVLTEYDTLRAPGAEPFLITRARSLVRAA